MSALVDHPLPNIDFSRHAGLLDRDLLARTRLACIGTGGASGLVQSLARCGIKSWTLVDFDHVTPTSPTTQAYHAIDIGRPKVSALADELERINPSTCTTAIIKPYSDLTADERAALWSADLVLAMTDVFTTQAAINRDAVRAGRDVLFAICYVGCQAVEITASFADTIARVGGCHRCHTKARYDAYDQGFQNPTTIASHALAADYLNALIGNIVLGRLHDTARSPLAISELGRAFSDRPCLISRITPNFGNCSGEAFAGQAPLPFSTSLWPLDTPADWTCPDCGTRGPITQSKFPSHTIPAVAQP